METHQENLLRDDDKYMTIKIKMWQHWLPAYFGNKHNSRRVSSAPSCPFTIPTRARSPSRRIVLPSFGTLTTNRARLMH